MTLFEISLLVGLAVSSAIAVGLLRSLRDAARNIARDATRYTGACVAVNERQERHERRNTDHRKVSLILVCKDVAGRRVFITDTKTVRAHSSIELVARTQIPVTVEQVLVASTTFADLYVGKLMKGQQSLNQGSVPLIQEVLDLLTPFSLNAGDESYVCEVEFKPSPLY